MERIQNFLEDLKQVPVILTEELSKQSQTEDEKNLVSSFQLMLVDQFQMLSEELLESAKKASAYQIESAEKMLKISSAKNVLSSMKLALPGLGSLLGKLGLDEIIKAIKKLIDGIITIFKLDWDWWTNIENIIDEIIEKLVGKGDPEALNILSQAEQNFLLERACVARLMREKAALRSYHQFA